MPKHTRASILATATHYVTRDRADDHGDMEDNFSTIAAYWNIHLGGTQVDAVDVGLMMAMVKIARAKSNKKHLDNFVDISGYAACAGELAMKGDDDDETH